jgi:hypothetical protein
MKDTDLGEVPHAAPLTYIGVNLIWWAHRDSQERIESIPSHLRTLTAADEHGSPQPADTTAKNVQLCRITRNSMVLVYPSPTLRSHVLSARVRANRNDSGALSRSAYSTRK